MRNFAYTRAADPAGAVTAVRDGDARFIAGGTELINLMRERIDAPATLVDISDLPLAGIEADHRGLRLGALARMSDVAAHPAVARSYPAIREALLSSASPQLRNMATMGGNLLQRTRCPYFRADTALPCNKRAPGSGCAAVDGVNRTHAIFGWSEHCVATHPSDLAVALAALDATVWARGSDGERPVPLVDFYRLPADAPERDTALRADELITAIDVPASPLAARSHYLKVRERASYEFALVSAAVAVEVEDDAIRHAHVALGGVAAKPWRLHAAEEALVDARLDAAAVRTAIEPEFAAARPVRDNAFKIELAKRSVVRALLTAGGVA